MELQKTGGLAVPNIRLYRVASQFQYVVDWVRNDLDSVWLGIKAYNLGNPLQLANLPFFLNQNKLEFADGNFIVKSTLKVWDMIKKWEKRIYVLSPIKASILDKILKSKFSKLISR